MLKTYLNIVPYTKFILITDSIQHKDPKLFEYLVKQQINRNHHTVHYFVFEGVFKRCQNNYRHSSNIVWHDFVSDTHAVADGQFENVLEKLGENDIVVIDSLSNVIFQCGLARSYRICNGLKQNKAIKQIVVVLHKDLIEGDCNKVCTYFNQLSTLNISVKPKFMSDNGRLYYEYKKSGGRIITQIEEYRFEDDNFATSKVEKPDPSKLMEKIKPAAVNPEDLSTFRIALTDEEKLSRDKVLLPYLPEAKQKQSEEEGNIIYKLDAMDDWDEEDPDDDLDI